MSFDYWVVGVFVEFVCFGDFVVCVVCGCEFWRLLL